ncbi:MAG: hypothetical protein IJL34_07500 [Treponema sp.]|nr:hypothetical protein [Treponema sp.]
MTEEEKKDSNKWLLHKVEEYRKKEHITDIYQSAITLPCALVGWHACIDWLEEKGIDVHKAF